jgi:uncharacterized protein
MEQRISLVTLGVKDLARARQFYEALGWSGAHQPDDEVCFFQAGGMVFGLWTALGGHAAPGIDLAHNVRSPEEVSAVLAEVERAGGTIVRPAGGAEWGGKPERSPTLTATYGRLPTIPAGCCTSTGPFTSDRSRSARRMRPRHRARFPRERAPPIGSRSELGHEETRSGAETSLTGLL